MALVLSLLTAARSPADLPSPPPPEAEALFARAAEALDRGQAVKSEESLRELRARYPLPGWEARIGLLLGRKAFDQHAFTLAQDLLSCVDARSIGLEGYRSYLLAAALEKQGEVESARFVYLRAASSGPFADQGAAALAFARLARTPADERLALSLLEQASAAAGEELFPLIRERSFLAERRRDAAALTRAAQDLLLRVPVRVRPEEIPRALRRRTESLRFLQSPEQRLWLAQVLLGRGEISSALAETGRIDAGSLPAEDRPDLFVLRSRIFARLHRPADSNREASKVARDGSSREFDARLQLAENAFEAAASKARRKSRRASSAAPPQIREEEARRLLLLFAPLAEAPSPPAVRRTASLRLLSLALEVDDRAGALRFARAVTAEEPTATAGFEALWRGTWLRLAGRDYAGALPEIEQLEPVYREISISRRLQYWQARCLEELGRRDEARAIQRRLAVADPPDLYARFVTGTRPPSRVPPAPEMFESTADFVRVDELLRLRFYEEARWEASRLPDSRGQRLRLGLADFALGDFVKSTALVKSVFPQIGTALESGVPDPWRRLFYPMDSQGLVGEAALEFGLDRNLLLALVRQESAFNPNAKSKAGASGLTQLMPATARKLSKSVLKKRFRKAFLYDPGINVRLGASYLRSLIGEFHGDALLAVAAYNGGPGRVSRVLRQAPGLRPDEILESLPASETRDYVRRVFLYAEAYRELYPVEKSAE